MTITGKTKIFEKSKILYKDGSTATASSNTGAANLILDVNKYTAWISVGSSDGVTEEIIITPDDPVTIDRLFLTGINFKLFNVQYYNGGAWKDFTTVVGLDGALVGGISETIYNKSTAYYEFTEVDADMIRIQPTDTQVVDAEKTLQNCVVTVELGTMEGNPKFLNPRSTNNSNSDRMVVGKKAIQKGGQSFEFTFGFENYPSLVDYNLMNSLFNSQETFLVWLCGGVYLSTGIRIQVRGFELSDLFNMQTDVDFHPRFTNSIWVGPWNANLRFAEVLPS